MPNISSSGNIRPQSITTMSSPYSKQYMFLPISPTPPSGMMRSGVLGSAIGGSSSVPASEQRQLGGVVVRRPGGAGAGGLEEGRVDEREVGRVERDVERRRRARRPRRRRRAAP